MKLYVSLLAADPLCLADEIGRVEAECDGFHIDIMDDHFVPNLAGGPALVAAVRQATTKPIMVHLMVSQPRKWVERLELRDGDFVLLIFCRIKYLVNFLKNLISILCRCIKPYKQEYSIYNY